MSYLATLGAGAVVVPLNPEAPSVEIEGELALTSARMAIVGPRGREAFAGVDRLAVELEQVFVPEGVRLDAADPLEELFRGEPTPCVARDEADDALLMFTAGTAGPRKAARLTHGNLVANLRQVQAHPGLAVQPVLPRRRCLHRPIGTPGRVHDHLCLRNHIPMRGRMGVDVDDHELSIDKS